MSFTKYSLLAVLFAAVFACEPYVEDKSDLGAPPNPTFDILAGSTPNEFILVNTTPDAFLTQWDLGDNGRAEGSSATVNFQFMGTYDVTMTTFNRGGSASLTKQVVVTQDDPDACFGNFELLTGCGEKTWRLAAEPAAMHIGPSLNETWWGNAESDVTERACHFDDQYIFRSNGEFEYNNQGDFWADSDENGNVWPSDLGLDVGCHANDAWPPAYEAWGSGVHSFNVSESSLTVTGDGAWIGLYKVGTADEVSTPQTSITYSISEITANRMVIFADYGWGVWRFTLVSE